MDSAQSGGIDRVSPPSRVWRAEGQQALRIQARAGDYLQITSACGFQPCEILVLNGQHSAFAGLQTAEASLTKAQLSEGSQAARSLQQKFDQWGVSAALLDQALVFAADALPRMTLSTDAELVIIAPGKSLLLTTDDADSDAENYSENYAAGAVQMAPTELTIQLWGALDAPQPYDDLPEPLAEPVAEYRIKNSTADVYEVKAGQWIQIIDVAGKQCSDLIAFDLAAIQEGREVMLDATATRTIQGLNLPQPGLHAKFLDADMQGMLEVVQDTVGRHDSFLFACTNKFYEDAGYFGHVSCSDNFNKALKPYGIAPRAGWPAINLFFNTSVGDCGTIFSDEPFSRAGDYVLLRAQRDLLIGSSACPDDIDPANGWTPTDIHVRVYSAEEEFPRAIAYRTLPEELPRMTKQTAFHPRTAAMSSHFTEYRGYWVAGEYDGYGARAEYLACRERVALLDLTPLRKFEVVGPDAEELLQFALTRNVRRLAIGEIVYTAVCCETGGMIDDGTLFRLGEQNFRFVAGDPYMETWLRELAEKKGYRVRVQNSSEQIHNLSLQGPQSRALLSEIIWTPAHQPDVKDLRWFHFTIGRLGGPQGMPVMVSRTGYTGELGFEIWCHPDHGTELWDAIWEAGQQYGIAPMGFDALDMLRIEAGLIFAEHEFCPQTNPYEAGIGFTVPMKTKEDDFVGRSAMAAQNPESRKKLVGLFIEDTETVSHGDEVYSGRYPVGVITSATRSPLLNKQIAMCRVAPEFSAPGTELEVGQLDGHKKRLKATVTTTPFYDPERTRVRS
ncbi:MULTISPECIES: DUF1989 domain-containing protein [unclassified Thalassolituus]|uniref:DUF1989 domain-containing protein n=1 Tax=unclassified Thalassolituus TaxID=2624967 RepID=UPI000C56BE40|nr:MULTISPECIES: aminomethyltransferase family protein [unclassified Thalassolituus]MBL36319.1 aminomethyltransferase [Oceanospirillaceae bacterium]